MSVYKLLQKCGQIVVYEKRRFHSAAPMAAARRGTRAKAEAKKKAAKVEEIKKVFIPYRSRLAKAKVGISPRLTDEGRPWPPVDDVHFIQQYKWRIFTVEEAVAMHRETAHETQFNDPSANLIAHIELGMSANKKNKYIGEFSNIITLPYPYEVTHKRKILVLCENEEMAIKYRNFPGIELVLGPESIRMTEKGELDFKAFDHVLAHVALLPDLITIRRKLQTKMPSVSNGTAGANLDPLIERFIKGIKYSVVKDKWDHDFGSIDFSLGPLTTHHEKLEANLATIVADIENQKHPARSARLITLVNLRTHLTKEYFKIDHNAYLPPLEVNEEAVAA